MTLKDSGVRTSQSKDVLRDEVFKRKCGTFALNHCDNNCHDSTKMKKKKSQKVEETRKEAF